MNISVHMFITNKLHKLFKSATLLDVSVTVRNDLQRVFRDMYSVIAQL